MRRLLVRAIAAEFVRIAEECAKYHIDTGIRLCRGCDLEVIDLLEKFTNTVLRERRAAKPPSTFDELDPVWFQYEDFEWNLN